MSGNRVFSILGKGLKANTANDLEPFLSELKDMEDVEEVHFGANSLGVEACQAIAEVLKTKKSLKIVDLADIFTGRLISEIPQALSALCDALKSHTSLIELDLSDNAFGGRCADAMVPFLSSNIHFQNFRLNNNGLGPIGGKIIAEAFIANADKCSKEGKDTSLKLLICGRNRLENGSSKSWATAFEKHSKSLKEVRMPQNGIRMEGIENLVNGLSHCSALEVLDLQDNTATRTGTRALVKVLPQWKLLRTLNLSDCILSSAGGVALGSMLNSGSNPNLEELRLAYGEFDKRTVELLETAVVQHMPKLAKIDLNGNRFDAEDECVEKLREALASNGHEDALDELDDMEDEEEEEDDEAEADEREEEAEEEEAEKQGGENDRVAPGEAGNALPPVSDRAADDLADLLASAHIAEK